MVHVSLTVEEMALVFSILKKADAGKAIISKTYGELPRQTLEDKLVTASHSLIAAGLVFITEEKTVSLREDIGQIVSPLLEFQNILQLTINQNHPYDPDIINVYIGTDNDFTALSIKLGVVYDLTHGMMADLDLLLLRWLEFSGELEGAQNALDRPLQISIQQLTKLEGSPVEESTRTLTELGFSAEVAESLIQDLQKPLKRGSVILTNTTSENFQGKNFTETGPGFLYLIAETRGWIFTFTESSDAAMANVLSGGIPVFEQEIRKLIMG